MPVGNADSTCRRPALDSLSTIAYHGIYLLRKCEVSGGDGLVKKCRSGIRSLVFISAQMRILTIEIPVVEPDPVVSRKRERGKRPERSSKCYRICA
jgi:hypothetical protein